MADPANAPVRILFADHAPFVGGAATAMLDLVAHLDRTRGIAWYTLSMPRLNAPAPLMPVCWLSAALLIDSRDPLTLAAAVRSVLTDSTLALDLRRRGLAHARLFTWERCARETLTVYHRLVDSAP
ncbi:MAG TPA: hypothetical protein VII92_15875 [Anaerolineae bacterium]